MSLRHALLGMLSTGPASGYDLLKHFEFSLGNVWAATQSQLYSELTKMADDGLVEVSAEGPRGRKEYAITEPGMTELRRWLMLDPEPLRRNATALRVFFLHVLEPDAARAYLRREAERAAERHEYLTELAKQIEGDEPQIKYGLMALEWGLRYNAMSRDWAEWAESQVDPS